MTINDFIKWERRRRATNYVYTVVYAAICLGAAAWWNQHSGQELLPSVLALVMLLGAVALFQGLSNIALVLPRVGNPITSSEQEIKKAYEAGPAWFRRLCEEADRHVR